MSLMDVIWIILGIVGGYIIVATLYVSSASTAEDWAEKTFKASIPVLFFMGLVGKFRTALMRDGKNDSPRKAAQAKGGDHA